MKSFGKKMWNQNWNSITHPMEVREHSREWGVTRGESRLGALRRMLGWSWT